MTGQRKATRSKRLKVGRVIFNGRQSVLSCKVSDISAEGIRIKLGEPYRVPDIFEIEMYGKPSRQARKVWIGVGELGAAFTRPEPV